MGILIDYHLQGSLDLSPWLFVIPADLAPFKSLMIHLGATAVFSREQYVTVLSGMREATRDGESVRPLNDTQLAQAISVIQALADLSQSTGSSGSRDSLLVPDDRGILQSVSSLAFNDAPWLGASLSLPIETRLVHPLISNLVAERVGVPSLRRLLIVQSSDALSLGSVASGSATEAFGQSEALTTRLRQIISDYPEGAGILMEMLQNADDAGATELKLLLDTTSYPTGEITLDSLRAYHDMWEKVA